MTVADLMEWNLRIPVPRDAGGVRESPGRARLTPEWFRSKLTLPKHVELVHAESAPKDCAWFCTLEQQWFLNACMETSFDTIPHWLRHEIDRETYYSRYRYIATTLVRPNRSSFFGGSTPFLTLHIRGGDRGQGPETLTQDLIRILTRDFKQWVVISETPATRAKMGNALCKMGCDVAGVASASVGLAELMWADFEAMVSASGVVSSIGGGWSAFPYAATRMSGAPLLFTSEYAGSDVWQLLRAHSKVSILGVHLGVSEVNGFLDDARRRKVV